MVGGIVVETIVVESKNRVWINCRDYDKSVGQFRRDECAIYVQADAKARCVSEGDSIWWQGGRAFWTPKSYRNGTGKCGRDYEIVLTRVGYSGASRPEEALAEA